MSPEILLFIAGAILAILFLVFTYLYLSSGNTSARSQMRNLVSKQRQPEGLQSQFGPKPARKGGLSQTAEEAHVHRKTSSKLTLRKKLKFAAWNIPPALFHLGEVTVSLVVFGLVSLHFNVVMQVISLVSGPIFMRWILNTRMDKRFKKFDSDYPQMIMSLVGLLKTGMNPMNALEAASQGLDQGSLVRQEIELMITRLRYGVPEDRSIGAFAEDIYHPEIELFVQALLLSRRVGGTLSDTLDRLSKQVRKRQYFRSQATAAVGLQRGSIWFILCILLGMEVYLYFVFPESVVGAINDPFGWQIWQLAICVILLGIFWVRQVTKIKV